MLRRERPAFEYKLVRAETARSDSNPRLTKVRVRVSSRLV